jgi:hypothetical protein
MNPILREALRRQWPLFGALGLFLIFALVHALVFQPTAARYESALKHAGEMGLAFDPDQMPQTLPPRVFALLADNAIPATVASERAASGTLTANLLDDLNKRIAAHGMEVLVTEPGPVTQMPHSVQVRAHLKIRCRYLQFTALLDDLGRSGSLVALDRFTLLPNESGAEILEVWVSRSILKQDGTTP